MNNKEFYNKILPETLKNDQTGPKIPLIMHMNMLRDKERFEVFKKEIENIVKPGMRVLELGSGTGVFSLIAAKCGGDVTSVELQRSLFNFSEKIFENYYPENIKVIRDDARLVKFDEKFDLIICEMIDTWMIREVQLQVMNHAIENFLKEKGVILPLSMENFVEPVEVDYFFDEFIIPLPFYETSDMESAKSLGGRRRVSIFDFTGYNNPEINMNHEINFNRVGNFNGIRLSSSVNFFSSKTSGSDWFTPPLILPIKPEIISEVSKKELVIDYICGMGFKKFEYLIKNI
jgi:predicted RNA methylase